MISFQRPYGLNPSLPQDPAQATVAWLCVKLNPETVHIDANGTSTIAVECTTGPAVQACSYFSRKGSEIVISKLCVGTVYSLKDILKTKALNNTI